MQTTQTDTHAEILAEVGREVERARAKFPGSDGLLVAAAEELGEAFEAALDGGACERARRELIQCACVCVRAAAELEDDGIMRAAHLASGVPGKSLSVFPLVMQAGLLCQDMLDGAPWLEIRHRLDFIRESARKLDQELAYSLTRLGLTKLIHGRGKRPGRQGEA